jgi:hypothetical protein
MLVLPADARVTPHPDVVATTLKNGAAVLLHLGTHTYYSLNETGSLIWALIEQATPLSTISVTLEDRYDVGYAQAQQAVQDLVCALAAQKLVVLPHDQSVH